MANETQTWNLLGTSPSGGGEIPPDELPSETWPLKGGTAWVYRSPRSGIAITRPVILADGFHPGRTKLNEFWDGLERRGFNFATQLRARDRDLVILGFDDCTAAIQRNADTAIECIHRALTARKGTFPLVVGGFSMGGLITRYALTKMEDRRFPHETAAYICYDSPHHGAWMPVGLQALIHMLDRDGNLGLKQQIDSPAARQLLWAHLAGIGAPAATPHPDRKDFLRELRDLGDWPQLPRLLGVANGFGARNNGVKPRDMALEATADAGIFAGTTLYTQGSGNGQLVAKFGPALGDLEIRTDGMPEADGAHGGLLRAFGMAAATLNKVIADAGGPAGSVKCKYELTGFVPTSSAIAVVKDDPWQDLGADVRQLSPDATALDDFMCSSTNTEHTLMTEELGNWILERLP